MSKIEVELPFVFKGENFFRVSTTRSELQRIVEELKEIKNGSKSSGSVVIDGKNYEMDNKYIKVGDNDKKYEIDIEDAIEVIEKALV